MCKPVKLNLPTRLPICHPTYQPANLTTNLPIWIQNHQPDYLPMSLADYIPTSRPAYLITCLHATLPPSQHAKLPAYLPAYIPICFSLPATCFDLFKYLSGVGGWVAGLIGNIAISAQLELELVLSLAIIAVTDIMCSDLGSWDPTTQFWLPYSFPFRLL